MNVRAVAGAIGRVLPGWRERAREKAAASWLEQNTTPDGKLAGELAEHHRWWREHIAALGPALAETPDPFERAGIACSWLHTLGDGVADTADGIHAADLAQWLFAGERWDNQARDIVARLTDLVVADLDKRRALNPGVHPEVDTTVRAVLTEGVRANASVIFAEFTASGLPLMLALEHIAAQWSWFLSLADAYRAGDLERIATLAEEGPAGVLREMCLLAAQAIERAIARLAPTYQRATTATLAAVRWRRRHQVTRGPPPSRPRSAHRRSSPLARAGVNAARPPTCPAWSTTTRHKRAAGADRVWARAGP